MMARLRGPSVLSTPGRPLSSINNHPHARYPDHPDCLWQPAAHLETPHDWRVDVGLDQRDESAYAKLGFRAELSVCLHHRRDHHVQSGHLARPEEAAADALCAGFVRLYSVDERDDTVRAVPRRRLRAMEQ